MFTKYKSLTNHTDKGFLNKLMLNGFTSKDIMWVAREKIHGANFSFIIKEDEIKIAKRTSLVGTESFYEADDLLKKYRDSVVKVRDKLISLCKMNYTDKLTIFGEYAGTQSSGRGIQHGVDYGKADFYAFDMCINDEYISEPMFSLAIDDTSFKTAPYIALGTFDQIISIDPAFDSIVQETINERKIRLNKTIHKVEEHGLNYTGNNTAEGFVMKPYFPLMLGEHRVIIKVKNEKFSERKQRVKNFVAPVALTEVDKEVLEELTTYVTENRIKNVLSKIGVPTAKQFGKVMGLTLQDILEESQDLILKAENVSVVKKALVNEVSNAIRDNWIKILRGDF